jgi:gliding motility-associated-like protein
MNPNNDYDWNTGETSQTINITATGIYGAVVSDAIGCIGSDSLTLTVNQLPLVTLGNDTTICKYNSLLLDAKNPNLNYIWSNGATTQKILIDEESIYDVEVRDEIGCLGTDEIMVYKDIIPDPFIEKDKIVCEGVTITLEPDPGYTDYTIFWISDTQNSSIDVSETGVYSSIVESVFCKDTFEINVTKIDTPDAVIIDLNGQENYCFDYETTRLLIESTDGGDNEFDWEDFGRTDEIEVIKSGDYKVEVSNEYCTSIYSKTVEEICTGKLFIPNSFTPDGDFLNDVFKPISNGYVDGYELRIYDRWGVPIFITNKIEEGWDGKIKDNIVLIDVYVYKITYNYIAENGEMALGESIGTVTLLK